MDEIQVIAEWPFLQDAHSYTVTADDASYALPTGFLKAAAMVDVDNDTTVPYVAPGTYFNLVGTDAGNTAATARFWTIWNGEVLFTPIPSANDTDRYVLYFYSTITAVDADNEIPEFNEGFHWAIVEYCKWKLYDREEYYDQSERARMTYMDYMSQMVDWYSNRVKLEPFAWGDGKFTGPGGDPNIPSLGRL